MTEQLQGHLARLYVATTALTSESLDEPELLHRIVREAAELTHASYAALGLLGPEGQLVRFVTTGLAPEDYEQLKDNPPKGRGILGALLLEGRPLRLDDLTQDPRSAGFPPGHPVMRSFLGVPLHLGGDVIGRLYMTESTCGAFTDEDEDLALGFAAAASVAIGNVRLNATVLEQSEAALVAAGRLRSTLDALERGVCMTDAAGEIVLANEPLALLLGLERSPVGMRERDFADHFTAPESFLSALGIEQAQPRTASTDYFELREAPQRTLRRVGRPILAPDSSWIGRIAVYSDTTRERELQEQMVAAERLRATGEMASGIAHDFNNLLATILGRAEVMLGQTNDPALRENLLAVQRAARDGAATVARMREYGRPLDAGEFQPIALETVVRQAVELTQPRWRDQAQREGRTIAVALQLQPTRPVDGDAVALREVLVNLIFNAVDAMPRGGQLTVGLAPVDNGAELTIRDTGHGIPPAVQRRMFEPFFTTKGERGSGLGLAMVRKVVASHGGRIDVTSAPGVGTSFAIWLPTTEAQAEGGMQPEATLVAGRIARIVVVDDQPDVLDTTAMLLREDGHDVRIFADPTTALGSVRADPPDLVISDLGMPGTTGWEVARAVHDQRPDTPVILLTGWGREISAAQMRENGIAAVLAKPVEGPLLRQAVGRVLAAAERPLQVLIVDDSAAFAAVLAMLISQDGHAVTRVESAASALKVLAERPFDLVIVDVGLPDRPAAEVVAGARLAATRPAVCVVSGSAIPEMERAIPDADLYLEKVRMPERLDELVRLARARPGG